jgi:hypothetical protein
MRCYKAFACLEFVAFGLRRISLAERSRSSFTLFILVLCAGFSLPLQAMPLVVVSGKSRLERWNPCWSPSLV